MFLTLRNLCLRRGAAANNDRLRGKFARSWLSVQTSILGAVAEERDKQTARLVATELGATLGADGTYRCGVLDGCVFDVVDVIWSAHALTAAEVEESARRHGARSLAIIAGPRGFGRSAEEAAQRKGITLIAAELWPTLRLRRHAG